MKLRIATRGSELALAQAYYIQRRIAELENAPETELIIIKTSGDKIQNIPLSQVDLGDTPQERKGFFTKEIEDALLDQTADLAVHSYKDLPSVMVDGLMFSAMPQRLEPRDIMLFPKNRRVSSSAPFVAPGARIGTSSVRRISQIEFLWPELKTVDLRGNVPTRINRLLEGEKYDAILLSGAGYNRLKEDGVFQKLGLEDVIERDLDVVALDPDEFVPAPAQGALALQSRSNDESTLSIIRRLHEAVAARSVQVEREILAAIEGGCHLPLGSHCIQTENEYVLHLYLGREAVDNRQKRSYYKVRKHSDPSVLSRWVIDEIKEEIPVVLTGREERIQELLESEGRENLISFPMLKVNGVDLTPNEISEIEQILAIPDKQSVVLTFFSVSGVRYFSELLEKTGIHLKNYLVGVTGEKTEQAVLEFFPDIHIAYRSADGTGGGLAKTILQSEHVPAHIIAVTTAGGREEFHAIMKEHNINVARANVYDTELADISSDDLMSLPQKASIVFASPSVAERFLDVMEKLSPGDLQSRLDNWRFCSIGKTTSGTVRNRGYSVYMQSSKPEFKILLGEVS